MEALTIALGLTGITPPRPMPAHFIVNVLKATGVHLEEVRIEALKDNLYYAVTKVRNGKRVSEIDARPSDALGLAVLMECPIFVAEEVLEQQGMVVPEGKDAKLFLRNNGLNNRASRCQRAKPSGSGSVTKSRTELMF